MVADIFKNFEPPYKKFLATPLFSVKCYQRSNVEVLCMAIKKLSSN